jgi:adenosylcobinamide kinase/adenosylcobinamide-phosphate guanylyltransferase
MAKSILITGGARSGKSSLAEAMVERFGLPATYIATAQAFDAEMEARIAEHRARRGPGWQTLAEPFDLPGALQRADPARPVLVDCLTLWLSNLMLAERDWRGPATALVASLAVDRAPVVIVTNEVGAGIVPENALARAFRDEAGRLNQTVAEACDALWLCVAGQPLQIK